MESILEKINKASLKFLCPLSFKETYTTISEEAKNLVGAEEASIFLYKDKDLERIYATSQVLYKIKIRKNGFVNQAFRTNTPILVKVKDKDKKEIHPEIIKANIKSLLLIPLSYEDKTSGVLVVYSLTEKEFSDKELDTLKLFGSMASLALRKAQLYSGMQKALEDRDIYMNLEAVLEKIHVASLKFLAPLSSEDTYSKIVSEAIKLVNANFGSLFIKEENELRRVYSSIPLFYTYKIRKDGYTYKSFSQHKSFVVGIENTGKIHPEIKKLGIKSTVFIPLFYKDESIGVLSLDFLKSENFTRKEFKVLKLFGSMASLAIRKSQLYSEVKKSLELRDLFISLAAHELRTPLTTLNGYIQLLNKKLANEDTSEGKWVKQITTESERLTNLIKELLQINRIKSGQLQYVLRECNLVDVVKQAVNSIRFNNPERDIYVKNDILEGKGWVVGDYEKLIQVFTNLLNNAIKFSLKKSLVSVYLFTRNSDVIVKIKDEGKGIAKEDLAKVFEDFYKGKNTNEEGGMGLGLYLAKVIIEKHHGKINISSKLNKGTMVSIILPQTKI